jgi:hypothetical protein
LEGLLHSVNGRYQRRQSAGRCCQVVGVLGDFFLWRIKLNEDVGVEAGEFEDGRSLVGITFSCDFLVVYGYSL